MKRLGGNPLSLTLSPANGAGERELSSNCV
jgi:hypothetical protein